MKPNNAIYQKCTRISFFRGWVEFLAPFHKLTARERDVMARILVQYFKFKACVQDPEDDELLKELLWSQTSRKDMRESLKMSQAHFQMILAKLRESGVLVNNDLNPKYIPHVGDEPRFMLSIIFDWSSDSEPVDGKKQD